MFEREEVAAGASGSNSGAIQHPFDPVLAELHRETLDHYRGMDEVGMPSSPAGVLMLAPEREPLEPAVREIGADCPELEPRCSIRTAVRELEPAVAPGLWACRLETGYPVRPIAATRAFARRAHAARRALPRGARPPGRGWPGRAPAACSPPASGARPAP